MRIPDLLTRGERRLALLLFVLAVLGFVARGAERLDPRVAAWLAAVDSIGPPPGEGGGPTSPVARPEAAGPPVAVAPGPDPRARGGASEKAKNLPARIDPNTAGSDGLIALPGIGPALAARILADREVRGPYRRPEDLLRVPGIGPAKLAAVRPFLDLPADTVRGE